MSSDTSNDEYITLNANNKFGWIRILRDRLNGVHVKDVALNTTPENSIRIRQRG